MDQMFNDISNVSAVLPTKAIHSKNDTMEEIRRQLAAMRTEQDMFSVAFEESIAKLQTQQTDELQTQSLLDGKDTKLLEKERIM